MTLHVPFPLGALVSRWGTSQPRGCQAWCLVVPHALGSPAEWHPFGILPADESEWSAEVLNGYFKPFQGLTGCLTRGIAWKREEARSLSESPEETRRLMRQDPTSGHLALVLAEEGQALSPALQAASDKLQVALPEPDEFPLKNCTTMMAEFPQLGAMVEILRQRKRRQARAVGCSRGKGMQNLHRVRTRQD